jgi:hypothetical protein
MTGHMLCRRTDIGAAEKTQRDQAATAASGRGNGKQPLVPLPSASLQCNHVRPDMIGVGMVRHDPE